MDKRQHNILRTSYIAIECRADADTKGMDQSDATMCIIFHEGYFLTIFDKSVRGGGLRFIRNSPPNERPPVNCFMRASHLDYRVYDYTDHIEDAFPKRIRDGSYFWANRDDIYRIKHVYGFPFSPEVEAGINECWNAFFEKLYNETPTYNHITMYTPTHMIHQELKLGLSMSDSISKSVGTKHPLSELYMFFNYHDALLLLKKHIAADARRDVTDANHANAAASRDYGIIRTSLKSPPSLQRIDLVKYENDQEYNRMVYDVLNRDGMLITSMSAKNNQLSDAKDYDVIVNLSNRSFTLIDGIREHIE